MNTSNEEHHIDTLLNVGRILLTETALDAAAETRFTSHVLGWSRDQFIILESSSLDSPMTVLTAKQQCFFRFMADGEVCAFTSIVLDRGTGPYSRIFRVAWPKRIKTIRLRNHDRIATQIPCAIESDQRPVITGQLIDLSMGGCGIFTPQEFEKGDRLTLSFDLPEAISIADLAVEVRRATPSAQGFELGCAFHRLSTEHQADLEYYIAVALEQLRQWDAQRWVLMIEPEPTRVAFLHHRFSKQKIKVLVARNAISGIARLGSIPPRAVFVAHNQPGCSGVDICRIIRSAPSYNTLPVYLYGLDGTIDIALEQTIKDAGITDYFSLLDVPEPIIQAVAESP